MSGTAPTRPQRSNAYDIFILVLTIYSLALMVIMLLPLDQATLTMEYHGDQRNNSFATFSFHGSVDGTAD